MNLRNILYLELFIFEVGTRGSILWPVNNYILFLTDEKYI